MTTAPTIDGYSHVTRIGRGGLGDVYRATQVSTGATVALKVLRDLTDSSVAWHRMRRELAALVALSGHANVVGLIEMLETAAGPVLVMEYARGGSVAELMAERGADLSVDETVFVGRSIASALVAAHARGIVHRDIKPQNLLIDGYGQVKLCDFGIAALTTDDEYRTRTNAVSMRYASPEDLEHDVEVGPASDVYSLGATLLHLVRGAPPTLKERLAPWTPPPTADSHLAALDRVLARCLHPNPDVRPTAPALLDALEGLAIGAGVDRVAALPVHELPDLDGPGEPPAAPESPAAEGAAGPALGADVGGTVADAPSHPSTDHLAADDDPFAGDDDTTVYRPVRLGDPVIRPVPAEVPRPPARRRSRAVIVAALATAVVVAVAAAWWVARDGDDPAPDAVGTASTTVPATAPTQPVTVAASSVASTSTVPATTVPPTVPTTVATTVPPSTAPEPASDVVTAPRPDGLADLVELDWGAGVVGDCLVQVPDSAALVVVGCADPHDLQRFSTGSLGLPADAAYDEAEVQRVADAACGDDFARFVGVPLDDSALGLAATNPSAESWAAGDRTYVCYLGVRDARVLGDAAASGW